MRHILALLIATGPAMADDFIVPAPVTKAVVYPQGATVTRDIAVDLPAGAHRILVPVFDGDDGARITGSDVTIGAVEFLEGYVTDPSRVFSEAQFSAANAVLAAEELLRRVDEEIARATSEREAVNAQIAFLKSINADGLETLDPTALRDTGTMVAIQLRQSFPTLQSIDAELETLQDQRETRAKTLQQVTSDFERLSPPTGPVDMLAISVQLDTPQTVSLAHEVLTGNASWSASYDIDLQTGDAPRLSIARKISVSQRGRMIWRDVDLTMSTADPFAQLTPQPIFPNQARIYENRPSPAPSAQAFEAESLGRAASDAAVVEQVLIEAEMQLDGDIVTYAYPDPVTIGGGALTLSLDTIETAADIFNRAVPRHDATAFLMASFTNQGAEPILPGTASLFRDGAFIGQSPLALIPAGARTELAFGPLDGLRLSFTALRNDTGDRGFISTSSTRRQTLQLHCREPHGSGGNRPDTLCVAIFRAAGSGDRHLRKTRTRCHGLRRPAQCRGMDARCRARRDADRPHRGRHELARGSDPRLAAINLRPAGTPCRARNVPDHLR